MLKKAYFVLSALLIYLGSTNQAFAQTPSASALLSQEPRNQYACVATYNDAQCSSYNPECLDKVTATKAPIPKIPEQEIVTTSINPVTAALSPTIAPQEPQVILTPTDTPVLVSVTPTSTPPISLNPDVIFALVNEYRAKIGFAAFEKDEKLCEIANSRKTEFAQEIATGAIHAGMRARKFPFWISENMKYGGNEQEMLNWWLASPIHHASLVGNYKYSCVACEGPTCNELFTSYTPK